MRHLIHSAFALLLAIPVFAAEPPPVQKIWDQGPHNAFTDLIRFQDRWWCTFRESTAHVGGNGKSRVLESVDGKEWKSAALVEETGIDLRDPKLSITPNGRLMMIMGGSIYEGKTLKGRQPRVAFSSDGKTWSAPKKVLEPDEWLWRVTWHDGICYGLSYNAAARSEPAAKDAASSGKVPPGPAEWKLKLVSSKDGETFETITHLDVPGHPNESTIRFLPDGRMAALIRREGGDQVGWVGTSKAPFKEWTYQPVGQRVGGPNFVVLPDGRLIAATRKYKPEVQTILATLDADKGKLTELLTLPSGGDNSYAGLVVEGDKLWVSYYSSHEKKSSIYLTSVPLADLMPVKKISNLKDLEGVGETRRLMGEQLHRIYLMFPTYEKDSPELAKLDIGLMAAAEQLELAKESFTRVENEMLQKVAADFQNLTVWKDNEIEWRVASRHHAFLKELPENLSIIKEEKFIHLKKDGSILAPPAAEHPSYHVCPAIKLTAGDRALIRLTIPIGPRRGGTPVPYFGLRNAEGKEMVLGHLDDDSKVHEIRIQCVEKGAISFYDVRLYTQANGDNKFESSNYIFFHMNDTSELKIHELRLNKTPNPLKK